MIPHTILEKLGCQTGDRLLLEARNWPLYQALEDICYRRGIELRRMPSRFISEDAPFGGNPRRGFYRWATHYLRVDAGEPLGEFNLEAETYRRENLRWLITMWPTQEMANRARISYPDLLHVFHAAMLEEPQPFNPPASGEFKIGGLTMQINLPWVFCRGEQNLPDGECFSAPVPGTLDGDCVVPYLLAEGREFRDLKLSFREGLLVGASQDFMRLTPDMSARKPGEVGIGLNKAISPNLRTGEPLLDEKAFGTFHIALGMSLPGADNGNRSTIHWDLVMPL